MNNWIIKRIKKYKNCGFFSAIFYDFLLKDFFCFFFEQKNKGIKNYKTKKKKKKKGINL